MATETAKKKPKPVVLPKKPSALIRIALEDLAKAERSPKCEINMGTWYEADSDGNGTCAVCLAGAVIRSRLSPRENCEMTWPTDCGKNERQLYAINHLREGYVSDAFSVLGRSFSKGEKFDRQITPYDRDRAAFKRDMRRLAADLEAAGY